MHEMSIAENIVKIVKDVLQKDNNKKLKEVVVEIGELMAVVPDSLIFCYEAITDGTALHGSKLKIKSIPIKVKCNKCNAEYEVKDFQFYCKECNSNNLSEISGRELLIRYLEVE